MAATHNGPGSFCAFDNIVDPRHGNRRLSSGGRRTQCFAELAEKAASPDAHGQNLSWKFTLAACSPKHLIKIFICYEHRYAAALHHHWACDSLAVFLTLPNSSSKSLALTNGNPNVSICKNICGQIHTDICPHGTCPGSNVIATAKHVFSNRSRSRPAMPTLATKIKANSKQKMCFQMTFRR